jgi:crotonobetainyl-CoA:carnitine CoA-transferase CaiB-like acyl-CoA transferase
MLRISEVLQHPQVEQAGFVRSLEHPVMGEFPQLGPPVDLSETPGALDRPPPLLGEHSREVLRELGYDDERIGALERADVLGVGEAGAAR